MKIRRLYASVSCIFLFVLSNSVCSDNELRSATEPVQVRSPEPDPENGRRVYGICVGCHQPEGWGTRDGAYPQIAGQIVGVTIKQMADIRSRNRDTPIMRPFTLPENLSPRELTDVSAYIAGLPMNPLNGTGPGTELELGRRLYAEHCAECHGERGQGDQEKAISRIQGQHYLYLVRQFDWIRTGKRRNADKKMVDQIQQLAPRETSAILDYVSRLRPPPAKLAAPEWRNGDFPKFVRLDPPPSARVCRITN